MIKSIIDFVGDVTDTRRWKYLRILCSNFETLLAKERAKIVGSPRILICDNNVGSGESVSIMISFEPDSCDSPVYVKYWIGDMCTFSEKFIKSDFIPATVVLSDGDRKRRILAVWTETVDEESQAEHCDWCEKN